MSWQPVLLWADVLIWLILLMVLLGGWIWADNLRVGWHRLLKTPVATMTSLVLLLYVGIGLLDSVHFRLRLPVQTGHVVQYSVEVRSVLDLLLTHLRTSSEQTYSAPLADYSFVKTAIVMPDGSTVFAYPELQIRRLSDPTSKKNTVPALRSSSRRLPSEVVPLALRGVAWGVGIVALLFGILRTGAIIGRIRSDSAAWRGSRLAGWLTVLVICILAGVMTELATVYHVMGTDKIGQDVLYQSIKGVRTGLMMGTLTTLVTLPLAVVLGISAGYWGGWVDDAIQFIYTTLNAIPWVLLVVAGVLLMQGFIETHPTLFNSAASRADFRLLFLCGILGVTSWTGLCRVLRGETLKLRELDYVSAARSLGVSDWRIMARHVLPNLVHLVLISMVMDFSGFVLAEAVLSYLGVGVDPAMASWGNMINAARLELSREPVVWWPLASAFAWMFVLVLSANLLADSVRDAFDPLGRRS